MLNRQTLGIAKFQDQFLLPILKLIFKKVILFYGYKILPLYYYLGFVISVAYYVATAVTAGVFYYAFVFGFRRRVTTLTLSLSFY